MTDVLIVGAGPVGLTLACELARRSVSFRVVDRLPERMAHSRAIGIHSRTLELFEGLGLIDAMLERGERVFSANLYGHGSRIATVAFDELDAPHPFILMLPQYETERLIEERLVALGGRVERGVTLDALDRHPDSVSASLKFAGGVGDEVVRVPWVVGCDGAHSTVRHAIGMAFDGQPYDENFVLADVDVQWDLAHDETHVFLHSDGALIALPLPGANRYRLLAAVGRSSDRANASHGIQAGDAPTLDAIDRLVRARGHIPATLSDPRWLAAFRIHRRIARSYHVGRVFLAGDAAHIHSPVGGQGMNTGIQDVANLAWKLELVTRGDAAPALLDSYHAERHPIASATLDGTDLATRFVTMRSAVSREMVLFAASVLSHFEVVQQRLTRRAAMLSLNYRRSALVGEHRIPLGGANLAHDPNSEAPSVHDWLDFGAGPAPGDRAPDVEYGEGPGSSSHRLFDSLRGTRHVLLLFDGAAATTEGYRTLERVGSMVREHFDRLFDVHIVVPFAKAPDALQWQGSVILDSHGTVHHRYGARSECLYVIRPDGYVGFRSQPADGAKLRAWIEGILGHSGASGNQIPPA